MTKDNRFLFGRLLPSDKRFFWAIIHIPQQQPWKLSEQCNVKMFPFPYNSFYPKKDPENKCDKQKKDAKINYLIIVVKTRKKKFLFLFHCNFILCYFFLEISKMVFPFGWTFWQFFLSWMRVTHKSDGNVCGPKNSIWCIKGG